VRPFTDYPRQFEIRGHGSHRQCRHESSTWHESGIKSVILVVLPPRGKALPGRTIA
jgi:hypothetical protein